MAQIQYRSSLRINGVEDVVPRQQQRVVLPLLAPVAVAIVLGAVEDGVEFRDKAHEAGVLELAVEVRGQGVGGV